MLQASLTLHNIVAVHGLGADPYHTWSHVVSADSVDRTQEPKPTEQGPARSSMRIHLLQDLKCHQSSGIIVAEWKQELGKILPLTKRTRLLMQHDSDYVVRNLMCHPEKWNGIIGTNPVCFGHPCDDNQSLCKTQETESEEFSEVSVAQEPSIQPRATKQLLVWCVNTGQWVGGLTVSPGPYPCTGEWKPVRG